MNLWLETEHLKEDRTMKMEQTPVFYSSGRKQRPIALYQQTCQLGTECNASKARTTS
jgi:predicted Rossmann-fold nucleotide-binding protein